MKQQQKAISMLKHSGLSVYVTMNIKVLDIDNNNTLFDVADFKDWLINKAKECGTGQHYEYYTLSDNKTDIGVLFEVNF